MSRNTILASTALTLAVLATLAGTPHRLDTDVTSIAHLIETERDHITPLELAEQLYYGKRIRLIDLRDSTSYVDRRIHNAERMSLTKLLDGTLKRKEVAVLYSDGGNHAAQAWVLLKTKGFDSVYTLLGGFAGWKRDVLYPELKKETTSEEKIANNHRRALSIFFGGEPKMSVDDSTSARLLPKKQSKQRPVPPVRRQNEEVPLRYHC